MEYMTMLAEPGLISQLLELIDDTEPTVVKRTIRVFTNVYRHSLSLLASGVLEPDKYEQSYAEISAVSNKLIGMLKTADNEGIIVHLVRYLEAALVTHILSDLTQFPHIAKMTAPVLKKGVDALLEFVRTPYVGGSAFCVAIRALISVACYQVNLRPCITDLAEYLINTPPPNLFAHNIRSFHKTLQRNLFRLLKRAESDADKQRLIDLMVQVGVPRRRLVDFAPRPKKRLSPPVVHEPSTSFRLSPPASKRIKLTEEEIRRFCPTPSIELTANELQRFGHQSLRSVARGSPPLETNLSDGPKVIPLESKPKTSVSITSILDQILSDNIVTPTLSSSESGMALKKACGKFSTLERRSNSPSTSRRSSQDDAKSIEISELSSNGDRRKSSDSIASSPRSPTPPSDSQNAVSNFEKTILNLKLENEENISKGASEIPFSMTCTLREGMIYEKLDCAMVVDILLSSSTKLPEEMPPLLQKTFIYDLKIMREKLAVALSAYLPNDLASTNAKNSKDLVTPLSLPPRLASEIQKMLSSGAFQRPSEKKSEDDKKDEDYHNSKLSDDLRSDSLREKHSPASEAFFSGKDVDLRCELGNSDIDMRGNSNSKIRQSTSNGKSSLQNSPLNQEIGSPTSPDSPDPPSFDRDPRLAARLLESQENTDPRLRKNIHRDSLSPSSNPPQINSETSSRDPRLSRKPGMMNMNALAEVSLLGSSSCASGVPLTNGGQYLSAENFSASETMPNVFNRDPRINPAVRDPRQVQDSINRDPRSIPQTAENSRDPRIKFSQNMQSSEPPIPNIDPRIMSNIDPKIMSNVDPRTILPNVDPRQAPNVDPRLAPNVDPRLASNADPRQAPNVDPRKLPNVDPRLAPNVDPRLAPNVDPRQAPNVDPRQAQNVDPRQTPNVDPRQAPNVDPRQAPNVDPRQAPSMNSFQFPNQNFNSRQYPNSDLYQYPNAGLHQYPNGGPHRKQNTDPRTIRMDGPRPSLLGAAPPLLQTPAGPPLRPLVPVYAPAGTGPVHNFSMSYAMSRYGCAETRNRF
ncbi:uncharacterized protein LOC108671857 isoform X2 [Hyalella azteca]|uniref:Uncharacterized protein LOC108671857 isoform X2 n=1 Tax=Hyalella azteca TaxID=294128 RepID=A0A8B7NPA1_HYAAZ|nr:uncharacterized protein LOC108671857 isoform X2 [Hyalella azteca]